MLTVDEALAAMLNTAHCRSGVETCTLDAACGRVLAETVRAAVDVPPADNSAMDGYALRHADWAGADQALPVSQRIIAGARPAPLAPGTAARIFTGAVMPEGADTVVMQEHCSDAGEDVLIRHQPEVGENVRPRGQDIPRHDTVLTVGRRLQPQDVALLASVGVDRVSVYRRLRVGMVTSGNELAAVGEPLKTGQVYDSNRYLLFGWLRRWELEPVDLGRVPDDRDSLRAALLDAAEQTDVILTTGGVSVGEEDHVRSVVAEVGRINLWKVAIRPGKPLAFGQVGDTPLLGLPGNPASVLVTTLVLARPFLLACQGAEAAAVKPLRLTALFDAKSGSRQTYWRARRENDGVALHPQQSSGALRSASWGDGLAVQYARQEIRRGGPLDFVPYSLLG